MSSVFASKFSGASALALLSILSIGATAQTTTEGQILQTVDVNQGIVLYASGNDLVLKMPEGNVRHFTVPADSKIKVDGNEVAVKDVKPGTLLTQTITTTRVAGVVTDVSTVDAKVLEVKSPYLTIATGNKETYTRVPDGTTFTINGKEMTLADLHAGMKVKGTLVTTVPFNDTSRSKSVTGQTPDLVGVLLFQEIGR